MRHPLKLAVTGLWTLGGLYLSLGAFAAAFLLLREGGLRSLATDVTAVLLLVPGIAYMLAAGAADRSRGGRKWPLRTSMGMNAIVIVAWVLLLGALVQRVGVRDLVLRPRNLGVGHAVAAILLLLIAYHARLVVHLVRAHEAGHEFPLESRGFDAAVRSQTEILPVLPISDESQERAAR